MLNWTSPIVQQINLLNDSTVYPLYVGRMDTLSYISSLEPLPKELQESFNHTMLYINISDRTDNGNSLSRSNDSDLDIAENVDSIEQSKDDDYECDLIEPNLIHSVTIIMYILVSIVGLFGNTLVIYVILRFSKMQTVTNIYIFNLAIADECFLIGIPFLLHTMRRGSWTFGSYMCKAYMVSTSITQFTSSIFLLIMSADRYLAVCHPISSPRYRTPFVSKVVSTGAWLTSALLMLPVMLFANIVRHGEHVSCIIKWPETGIGPQSETTFILYSLVLGFATPLIFIMSFYCLVIQKLQTVGPKRKSREKRRSHRKVTTLVLTVITVYIFCWLPYWILQMVLIMSTPKECVTRMEVAAFLFVSCLSYSNSAINPILYAFLSENFKKSFVRAFNCGKCRRATNALPLQAESSFPSKQRMSHALVSSSATTASTCVTVTTLIESNIQSQKTTTAFHSRQGKSKVTTSVSLLNTPKCCLRFDQDTSIHDISIPSVQEIHGNV